ncbi:MAG: YtxH domain-containing protein, partial [Slackia faecicanis]|nr:YtxH domain-containing protein [Slackia faecicanis]
MAKKFGAFVMGGLVGAGIALLCAPRKGVETRALVADKASTAFGQVQSLGGQAAERGQEFYSEAVASGQRAYDQAVAAGQTVYTDVTAMGRQAYDDAAQR